MRNPFADSLMGKLTALFICASVIPMVILGGLSLRSSIVSLESASFAQLEVVRDLHKREITEYLQARVDAVRLLAGSPGTLSAFDQLFAYHDSGGSTPEGPYDVAAEEYKTIYDSIEGYLKKNIEVSGDDDLFFICAPHGHVMFSVAKESDLGTNLGTGPYKDSGLARLWAKVVRDRKTSFVDYTYYTPSQQPAAFIGASIFDQTGDLRGLVAVRMGPEYINTMLQQRAGMGDTGESYIVGEDLLMRSNLRFEKESTVLKRKNDTEGSRAALEGKEGTDVIEDYRGIAVLSAYSPVGLKESLGTDFDWALLSEIDEAEAFAPIRSLLVQTVWIGVLIAVLAAVAGYFAARGIASPIRRVSELAGKVGQGELTVELSDEFKKRSDEVGALTESFQKMVDALRGQTAEIGQAVNVVSASSREIAAGSRQQVTNLSQSATALNQMAATTEEFKTSIQEFADRARSVLEAAQETAKQAAEGISLTRQSATRSEDVRSHSETAGESVLSLVEHMQRIGEITSAVNEIAEQTKLLALNASIEAARAGEGGRGFAVVATQVRELANQSKQAALRIDALIGETQKSTQNVVGRIEEGSRLSDQTAELAETMAERFQRIADSIGQTAEAVKQIAAGAQQQEKGVVELAQGMTEVNTGAKESLAAAEQTQKSIAAIDQRLTALNDSMARFKT